MVWARVHSLFADQWLIKMYNHSDSIYVSANSEFQQAPQFVEEQEYFDTVCIANRSSLLSHTVPLIHHTALLIQIRFESG